MGKKETRDKLYELRLKEAMLKMDSSKKEELEKVQKEIEEVRSQLKKDIRKEIEEAEEGNKLC